MLQGHFSPWYDSFNLLHESEFFIFEKHTSPAFNIYKYYFQYVAMLQCKRKYQFWHICFSCASILNVWIDRCFTYLYRWKQEKVNAFCKSIANDLFDEFMFVFELSVVFILRWILIRICSAVCFEISDQISLLKAIDAPRTIK